MLIRYVGCGRERGVREDDVLDGEMEIISKGWWVRRAI